MEAGKQGRKQARTQRLEVGKRWPLVLLNVLEVLALELLELGPLAARPVVGRDEVQAEVGQLLRVVPLRQQQQACRNRGAQNMSRRSQERNDERKNE
jgi:hypothetical protein